MFSAFIVLFMTLCSLAYAETAFVWPVEGEVITEFMDNTHVESGQKGIDIEAPVGTLVRAAADGVVRCARTVGNNGLTVSINHYNDRTTTYTHLSEIWVSKNDKVGAGDQIGLTGTTGRPVLATPHLRFGVYETSTFMTYKKYVHINPRDFLLDEAAPSESEVSSTSSLVPSDIGSIARPSLDPMAISAPMLNPKQVPPLIGETALIPEAQDVKGIVVQPDQEPIAPKETVSGLKESTSGQSAALAKNLSPSPGSSPHIDTRVGEILSPPVLSPSTSSKGVEPTTAPNSRFTNDRQSGTQPGITTDFSDAEVATNPGQIALLSIACLLTLSFTFKKRIAGFLASRAGFLALRIYPAPALGENGQW